MMDSKTMKIVEQMIENKFGYDMLVHYRQSIIEQDKKQVPVCPGVPNCVCGKK